MADAPEFKPQVVLPGERLDSRIAAVATDVKIGRGIANGLKTSGGESTESVVATKAGVFRFRKKNRFWVESNQKRFVFV